MGRRKRRVSLEDRVLAEQLRGARLFSILLESEFIEKKYAIELSKKRDPRDYVS